MTSLSCLLGCLLFEPWPDYYEAAILWGSPVHTQRLALVVWQMGFSWDSDPCWQPGSTPRHVRDDASGWFQPPAVRPFQTLSLPSSNMWRRQNDVPLPVWFFFFFFLLFLLSRGATAAYGSSQARGSNQSYSCRPTPQQQQPRIQATSATYTTAHGNARSLTHWVRPGIEPTTSWFSVGFVSAMPRWELPIASLYYISISLSMPHSVMSAWSWPG